MVQARTLLNGIGFTCNERSPVNAFSAAFSEPAGPQRFGRLADEHHRHQITALSVDGLMR